MNNGKINTTYKNCFMNIMPHLRITEVNKITKEEKKELNKEILELNTSRLRYSAEIIIFIHLLLIIVDMFLIKIHNYHFKGYRNLIGLQVFMIAISIIYLLVLTQRNKVNKTYNLKIQKIKNLSYIISILVWCSLVAINAHQLHNQISAYIIGSFFVAMIVMLTSYELLLCYSISLLILFVGISSITTNGIVINGHIVNVLYMLILCIVANKVNYYLFVDNYKKTKEINEKKLELEKCKTKLEEKVKRNTIALINTNRELIQEMNSRHNLEIQTAKAELIIEKSNKKLHEAEEYEKIRTEFFANISHEFKTPLNVIFSAEQMLERYLDRTEEFKDKYKIEKYTKMIKQNCYRLIRMIGNLIDITKIDAGYFKVKLQNYDIISIVENISLSVAEYIEDKEIELIFDTEVEEKIIACDPEKIERVVLNLLSNAVKFTPQKGSIYINIYEKPKKILISIKDTGIGIPEEIQGKIFERFVQVDKSINRNQEGSGIGLSLVKSLVELHNGIIYINKEYKDGTEFIIELPKIKIPEEREHEEEQIELKRYSNSDKVQKINIEFSDIYY